MRPDVVAGGVFMVCVKGKKFTMIERIHADSLRHVLAGVLAHSITSIKSYRSLAKGAEGPSQLSMQRRAEASPGEKSKATESREGC